VLIKDKIVTNKIVLTGAVSGCKNAPNTFAAGGPPTEEDCRE